VKNHSLDYREKKQMSFLFNNHNFSDAEIAPWAYWCWHNDGRPEGKDLYYWAQGIKMCFIDAVLKTEKGKEDLFHAMTEPIRKRYW